MYDVGFCENHNRVYEGLCKNCETVVCASCVLFGSHQKHDIVSLKEGASHLRDQIDSQIKRGTLKKEFSESHLLEIREYHLRLEKFKNDTVKKIDGIFKEIITTLKRRKNEIITEIIEKFSNERELILNEEGIWNEKQDISEKLISLSKESDEANLLVNSKFIMDGIRRINENLSFKEIQVYNNFDTSLVINKNGTNNQNTIQIVLSHEEIVYYLSKYLIIDEPNILEFKS